MSQSSPGLRVEIRKLGNAFFAVTYQENGVELCTNQFEHNPTGLTHLGPLWLLERGTLGPDALQRLGGLSFSGKTNESQVAHYGRQLYRYLFGNGRKIQRFIKTNPRYQQAHLTLSLNPEAAPLWRLPWEYLHDGDKFLCLGEGMRLLRRPLGLDKLTLPTSAPPLRILSVISAPDDQEELDVERELAVLQDAVSSLVDNQKLELHFLNEATVPALRKELDHAHYHVLHYIGHGTYNHKQQRGFLCFEKGTGETDLLDAMHLEPLLQQAPDLRLVVLSACQSAQIGVLDAFDSVATHLLHAEVPAVLAIPTSLQDESTIEMARKLYTGLAHSLSPAESLAKARLALKEVDDGRQAGQQRFDWGVPALYLRTPATQLIDPVADLNQLPPPTHAKQNINGLPLPHAFVGRRKEIQALRRALHDHSALIYLWGEDGVGKSTLIAQLISEAATSLDDVLVIHCQDLLHPTVAIGLLADFWRYQGSEEHVNAAALLLDNRYAPGERAREALQSIGKQRYLIIFDDIDALYAPAELSDGQQVVSNHSETLAAIIQGFVSARANTTVLITSHQPYTSLQNIVPNTKVEIHLSNLTQREAVLLMNTQSHLNTLPLNTQLKLRQRIDNHPQTLELLNGWAAAGNSVVELVSDPPIRGNAQAWCAFLLSQILDQLDPGESEVLTAIAVLKGPIYTEIIPQITDIALKYAEPLLKRWHKYGLVQIHHSDAEKNDYYIFHTIVRQHLYQRLHPNFLAMLHNRAAKYYAAPFLDEARRQILSRSSDPWSEDRLAWLARSGNGILGMWLRQTQNLKHAQSSMSRALTWQYHLFNAGDYDAAAQITKAIIPVLKRWGQRDLAEALLNHSIATQKGDDRVTGLQDLAKLRVEQGDLQAALDVYEDLYQTLEDQGAQEQMAHVLTRIGNVYYRLGNLELAKQKYEAALIMMREVGDEKGQSTCLHKLTRIYNESGDYKRALVRGQATTEFETKRGDKAGLARAIREQGLILKKMHRPENALEFFRKSLSIARAIYDEAYIAEILEEIGETLINIEQNDAALKVYTELQNLYQRNNNTTKTVAALKTMGGLCEKLGRPVDARQHYNEARRLSQTR